MIDLRVVGKTIQLARERRDWTQAQLGAVAGLPQQYISRVEKGKANPNLVTFSKFAEAFGRAPSALLHEIERESNLIPASAPAQATSASSAS